MENNEMFLDIFHALKDENFSSAISSRLDISSEDSSFGIATIEGKLKNISGSVRINLTISGMYKTACDRCLAAVAIPLTAEISTSLTSEGSEDDSVIISDGKIDLIQTAYHALALEIPIKILCKEDCKGLCAVCGKDLNKEKCECS